MTLGKLHINSYNSKKLLLVVCFLLQALIFFAQEKFDGYFKMRGKSMYIDIPRVSSLQSIDSFAKRFSITDIGLYELVLNGQSDSLTKGGWEIDKKNPKRYTLAKPLAAVNNIRNPEGRIIFSAVPTPDTWRIVGGNKILYGFNQFKGSPSVVQDNDVITFYLDGYRSAESVRLAGNFTNWQFGAFPMAKTDKGWMVKVKLNPGAYYYKFIVGGGHWIKDPANLLSEDDGRGNINSVVYVINKVFYLENNLDARKVNLAGSFNNWDKETIPLRKIDKGWVADLYLEAGTHEYEYWVDGKRLKPEKIDSLQNGKSVTSLGDNYTFKLKGYRDATKVIVTGNFIDWNENKLSMRRTVDGWELSYALGAGNFQYKFIVDGRWMTDPDNKVAVNDGKGNINSFMVIGANYEFRLKGFPAAAKVYLSGDFCDWCTDCIPMKWNGSEWVGSVYLARGKHLYKFIVDGNWIIDPANKNWEGVDKQRGNSVLWKE